MCVRVVCVCMYENIIKLPCNLTSRVSLEASSAHITGRSKQTCTDSCVMDDINYFFVCFAETEGCNLHPAS